MHWLVIGFLFSDNAFFEWMVVKILDVKGTQLGNQVGLFNFEL